MAKQGDARNYIQISASNFERHRPAWNAAQIGGDVAFLPDREIRADCELYVGLAPEELRQLVGQRSHR